MTNEFSSNSAVWVDGQVRLPKHVLKALGIVEGHRSNVTFIVEGDQVKIVNSSVFAMGNLVRFQKKGTEAA